MKHKSSMSKGMRLKAISAMTEAFGFDSHNQFLAQSPEFWLGRLIQALGSEPALLETHIESVEEKLAHLVAARKVLVSHTRLQNALYARHMRQTEDVESMPLVRQFRKEMAESSFMGGAPLQVKRKAWTPAQRAMKRRTA